MQLTDWHAFVYMMRYSQFIFWPWKLPHLVINGLFQTIFLTHYNNSLAVSTPCFLQPVM